ncbi:MAG TPA: alpha/beta fold hydrolase [Burkholderiaceae bacterium]|nr:alpha/beta fold hydrolase [Burkholderiaceae bacterium]
MKPLRILLAALAAVLTIAGCASLDTAQRKAIFRVEEGAPRWSREAPAGTEVFDLKLGAESVRTWYLPAAQAGAPTLLYLHGARWNLNGSVFRIERWQQMGFNVLAIDYRGFGASSPRVPSEASAYEDARLAFEELKRREPRAQQRYVYGHSLGGAIAIDLATRPDTQGEFAGLIVEASFTRIADLVREFKWGWLPGLSLLITQDFDSLAKVRELSKPVLFIHGTQDGVVPWRMSEQLFAAAQKVPATARQLLIVEGGNHSGFATMGNAQYRTTVERFISAAQQARAARSS